MTSIRIIPRMEIKAKSILITGGTGSFGKIFVEDAIIIEAKAVEGLLLVHKAQIISYKLENQVSLNE